MVISTHGAKHFLGGLPAVERELVNLGHTISDSAPDLVYSQDATGFSSALAKWHDYGETPKLILNVLDIPFHVPEINEIYERLSKILPLANKVTTISNTVKNQIQDEFNINADVIYYPARNVYKLDNVEKRYDFFINGRVFDKNKRAFLACQVLDLYKDKILVSCGSEYLKCAMNAGVVDDNGINHLYNYSRITFAFGRIEGIGMQVIESQIVGTPVITLSDNKTNQEFCPPEMIVEPNINAIKEKIDDILNNYDKYQKLALEYRDKYKEQFSGKSVAKNILQVYQNLI